MANDRRIPVSRLAAMLAVIWRLAIPYFKSEDRLRGRALLAAVIAIELSITAINVMINQWNSRFYNALQERDWDTFVRELLVFSVLAGGYIVLAVYQLYLRQWLQIRWRTWMTRQYLDRWLADANHYRMQLLGDAADNPDQRISEDINLFVERGLFIGLKLLGAVVTLLSFIVILWTLSDAAPFRFFGYEVAIPGYLLWAALIYAVIGTALTHLIGKALIRLSFLQQRYEADFRFNLVRTRENSEQIALMRGEAAEQRRLLDRFASVIANWQAIMSRTKKVTSLTSGYAQFAVIFPYIVASPAYFAERIQLGGLMQTASAFGSVQEALSVIITVYRDLADWLAVVDRLDGFNAAIGQARAAATAKPAIALVTREHNRAVAIEDLLVRLPNGVPLVAADHITIVAGENVLVSGPSGAGKSTLFRAIAGIWPFGQGMVVVPERAKLVMLPQRPYFPVATLAAAVAYPSEVESFGRERIAEAVAAVGLPALAARLDEEAHWNRMLSLGEQQRLGLARALLQAPDFLFLDEATASLDEPAEAALYRLIEERLGHATVVSIGHRATLAAFHRRRLDLVRDGDVNRLRESALSPAAL
jgi:vitamin B12/bleomycin/antimicrobial peptide transport system ATP-binding/permease protein